MTELPIRVGLAGAGWITDHHRDAIAHFLDRLRDGEPFETSPEDNLETLAIVEEAYGLG